MKNNKVNILIYIAQVISNDNNIKNNKEFCLNNNLLVQRIFFFIFGLFYKKYEKQLIKKPDFRAWKYGIIEANYYKWVKIKDEQFLATFNTKINNEEMLFIENIIKKLSDKNPWDLVELSQISYAWYINQSSTNNKIKINDIIKSFEYLELNY
ncbi:MAG: SocA family protein [Ureaplasma sp.]|nr:SocA family protein [Ureaplasma sp.]